MSRLSRIASFALAMLLAGLQTASAQAFPDRPVRIIVGYPPGGGTDLVARLVQQPLATRWGQPVVIDNRPGANAIIAADAVGGQVQVTYASVASVLRFVQAGRLRALAVTSKFARIAKAGNIHAE